MMYSFKQFFASSVVSASVLLSGCGAASGNLGQQSPEQTNEILNEFIDIVDNYVNTENAGRIVVDTTGDESIVITIPKFPEDSETEEEPAPVADPYIVAVTDSNNDGHVPAWTLDSSITDQSRWSALPIDNTPPWIQYELSHAISVDSVNIVFFLGGTRSTTVQIETSLDGNTWDVAMLESSTISTQAYETFSFTARSAKFVRIVGFGNSSNKWTSLLEFSIPGVAVAESLVIPPL